MFGFACTLGPKSHLRYIGAGTEFFANLQRNIIFRRFSGTIASIKPGDYGTLGPDFPDVR